MTGDTRPPLPQRHPRETAAPGHCITLNIEVTDAPMPVVCYQATGKRPAFTDIRLGPARLVLHEAAQCDALIAAVQEAKALMNGEARP